jgi:hypothetical protein
MGEYAEMMLDGTCCEACGGFFGDSQAPGYPRYHKRCRPTIEAPKPPKHPCPICQKKVKAAGLADHMRDAHQMEQPK